MSEADHERARKLLAAVALDDITVGERNWLDRHLAGCTECSSEAGALSAAVQSLRVLTVAASPELVQQTKLAVYRRAQQLQAARSRSAPLWIATAISSIWMILTAPYVWRTFAWFGQMAHMPDAVWQAGFLMWWFLPATVLAAAAASRYTASERVSNWANESNWGQR